MSKNDGVTLDDDSCLECGARYFEPSGIEGLCLDCLCSDVEASGADMSRAMDWPNNFISKGDKQ